MTASRYAQARPRREARAFGAEVPRPPEQCGVSGCESGTAVLFVIARRHGRECCGAFADFCEEQGAGAGRFVKAGVEFVEWVSRCARHYHDDLYRTGKGKYADIARDGRPGVDVLSGRTPLPQERAAP
ncbi:MAG: hypothetical protein ACREPJ_12075 [Rhodanobacteraceae bacterium]